MAATLGHYLEQIDRLTKENDQLKADLKQGGSTNLFSADSGQSSAKSPSKLF